MIRETLPDCGGQTTERILTIYRLWHCFDCGLDFSMKTRELPKCCPRCMKIAEVHELPVEGVSER